MTMTKEELNAQIDALRAAAESMDEPDRTFKLTDVTMLQIKREGMALKDLTAKLKTISLPKMEELDQKIQAAKDATAAQSARAAAFDTALGILKTALGVML